MARLQERALARTPIPTKDVEGVYVGLRSKMATEQARDLGYLAELCESHERLRAELEGCDVLLKASETANRQALGFVKYALEFWDWGQFPNLQESVEELRSVLISCVGDTPPPKAQPTNHLQDTTT